MPGPDRATGDTHRTTALVVPRPPDEVLAWGHDVLEPALRAAVHRLPDAVRRVAEFHFGWCDELGCPTTAFAGKALRPTLALLTAEAAGVAHDLALPAAVAVELTHNFTLLHDDVIDGDVLRRRRSTAWSVFGMGQAVFAGSALQALAFDTLAAAGGARAQDAMRLLNAAVQDLLEGQMTDLAFETRDDVRLEECVSVASAKSGALMGCACALGELFATGDELRIELMRAFGQRLGLVFALVDDMLGIWGDPAMTGKAIHSDITARKKSLPIVAAMNSNTPQGRELALLYGGSGALSAEDVEVAAALVAESGGRAWAEAEATRQLSAALRDLSLACAGTNHRAGDELRALAELVRTRER